MRSKTVAAVVLFVSAAACRSPSRPDAPQTGSSGERDVAVALTGARAPAAHVEVKTYGELRAMMHEGKTEPNVKLSDIASKDLYALGALSELRGEVTVLGGSVWLGYPEGDQVRVVNTESSDEQATLLVSANVNQWRELTTSKPIAAPNLDAEIESLAKSAGIDVEEPFPVLIDGEFTEVQWHVIDGTKVTAGPSTHEQHRKMGAQGAAKDLRAMLLGFFSKKHMGVFTHHGENTHFHLVDPVGKATGHVDSVSIAPGARVRVPG
jgi:acetolactate decarboxylase